MIFEVDGALSERFDLGLAILNGLPRGARLGAPALLRLSRGLSIALWRLRATRFGRKDFRRPGRSLLLRELGQKAVPLLGGDVQPPRGVPCVPVDLLDGILFDGASRHGLEVDLVHRDRKEDAGGGAEEEFVSLLADLSGDGDRLAGPEKDAIDRAGEERRGEQEREQRHQRRERRTRGPFIQLRRQYYERMMLPPLPGDGNDPGFGVHLSLPERVPFVPKWKLRRREFGFGLARCELVQPMGSTVSTAQWLLLAATSGVLYLVFDAARHFVYQLGPVRLRSWGDSEAEGPGSARWVRFDSVEFSLISGAVLQMGLVASVGATAAGLWPRWGVYAAGWAILFWAFVVVLWKFVLAFIPDPLAERALRAILPISHATYVLLWPILAPLGWLYSHLTERREEDESEEEASEEEVQAYIDVGEEEGIFEEGEGRLVQLIVDFGDRVTREVMTPRVDIVAFEVNSTLQALANLFSESKYSRIPIYEQNIDRIAGVVHVKDLFEALLTGSPKTVRELLRPAYFVPETKPVTDLLREFQLEHEQVAIVHDEFGGTAGLVTIEDLLEEIVGEIADEHEEEEEESVVQVDDEVYLVNGLLRVERLEELFDVNATGEGYETVGGLIFTKMGRVPRGGEAVRKSGLLFEVERADRKRIYRVRVCRDPDATPEGESADERGQGNGRYERSRA